MLAGSFKRRQMLLWEDAGVQKRIHQGIGPLIVLGGFHIDFSLTALVTPDLVYAALTVRGSSTKIHILIMPFSSL